MNALYVTVSIPLLLVLVGFNHAHGLTTFGKSNSNTGTPQTQQQNGAPKHCTTQANCSLIKGTTCLRGYCFCGDNTNPSNGACPNTTRKAPKHLCQNQKECVEGAECMPNRNKTINSSPDDGEKTCQCQEGLVELINMCGGASTIRLLPGLILMLTILLKTLY